MITNSAYIRKGRKATHQKLNTAYFSYGGNKRITKKNIAHAQHTQTHPNTSASHTYTLTHIHTHTHAQRTHIHTLTTTHTHSHSNYAQTISRGYVTAHGFI